MPRATVARSSSDAIDGIRTPDGRYIVVRGRLWRASNPGLEAAERERWVKVLMDARRAIASSRRTGDAVAEKQARRRVHRAKVALGERGDVWWDDGAPDENRRLVKNTRYAEWFERAQEWRDAIDGLLAKRRPGASICPSDAARAAAPRGWRAHLEEVREVARHLARRGHLVITQRGHERDPDLPIKGPVRYRRP